MALTESVTYNDRGKPIESSLMQYRIPTREDIGRIEVELVSSYEERGPFGAKSIGEVVINTSAPAIQEAVYQATGKPLSRAGGGTRTHTPSRTTDFESVSSANSDTPAYNDPHLTNQHINYSRKS